MSNRFTPGPWRLYNNAGLFITSDCGEICQIEGGGIVEGEDAANGHLMAAAPELYAVVKGLLAARNSVTMGREKEIYAEWIPKAEALIWKLSTEIEQEG